MLQFATYYHIYNHANGDDNLFREERNYPFFLEKCHLYIDAIADTLAWCLMPNHFHLLVRIKDLEQLRGIDRPGFTNLDGLDDKATSNLLTRQFSNFFNSYTKSFNKVYQRRGSLFLKNFKRKAINSEAYLQQLILYIHLNPVKHGFTTRVDDWNYSSYKEFWHNQRPLAILHFGTQLQFEQVHQKKQQHFKEYTAIENHLLS